MNGTIGILSAFYQLSIRMESHAQCIIDHLTPFETHRTACIELHKTIRALRTYDRELPALAGRRPLGTVAICLPFNNPLYGLVLYGFGPLLAENNVILRPSELTHKFIAWFAETLLDDFIRSRLNIYHGNRRDFIRESITSFRASCLMLTGSWNTAESIAATIPPHVKLIYSGSALAPFIILKGANIEAAVAAAVYSKTYNSGQDCLSAERFYVEEAVYDTFVGSLTSAVRKRQ